jgi:hypothetical protein
MLRLENPFKLEVIRLAMELRRQPVIPAARRMVTTFSSVALLPNERTAAITLERSFFEKTSGTFRRYRFLSFKQNGFSIVLLRVFGRVGSFRRLRPRRIE